MDSMHDLFGDDSVAMNSGSLPRGEARAASSSKFEFDPEELYGDPVYVQSTEMTPISDLLGIVNHLGEYDHTDISAMAASRAEVFQSFLTKYGH